MPRSFRELGRAAAGAGVFALPILMTMEMWELGSATYPVRLALFLCLSVPLLTGLAMLTGSDADEGWKGALREAFLALFVGAVVSVLVLTLCNVIDWAREDVHAINGKVALQTVTAAMGAVLARAQFGEEGGRQQRRKERAGYPAALFLMAAGALYLAFNLAPTEEMVLIAYMMTPWHAIALTLFSVILLHAFVYEVGFYGEDDRRQGGFWDLFLRYSIVGYAVTFLVCGYILWTFGRLDGLGLSAALTAIIVLAFPGALGGAAARLVL
ncbi:TIGR02587 family membrane protein [Pseudoroseomonas globiformis]|uniref:TIGR02587 family membrane protein n=1 Tax=Teichococcus globiformis TaxID=2307229 RepID=A0ABV7G205_9PROT